MSVRVSNLISSPSGVILSEWVRKCAVHFRIHASVLASFPSPCVGEAWSCHVHLRPHEQLILTYVNGLLVLYFPVIFFIPLMPCKISFFLPMSLLSSRLLCFKFSFSIRLLALPISAVRRAFHLSCCLTSFWKVVRRCRNPSPCTALFVAPLILS